MITPDDHGGLVTIAAAAGLSYMLLCFLIRIYIRSAVSRRIGSDDATLALATVSVLSPSLDTSLRLSGHRTWSIYRRPHRSHPRLRQVSESSRFPTPFTARKGMPVSTQGGGHARMLSTLAKLIQLAYAGDILFIVTLCLSKCSVILLLAGLTRDVNHSTACKVILGISAAWGVASVFTLALRCELNHPWLTINAHCTHLVCYSKRPRSNTSDRPLVLAMAAHSSVQHRYRSSLGIHGHLSSLEPSDVHQNESNRRLRIHLPASVSASKPRTATAR